MATKTKTAEKKQEFTATHIFALWKRTSQNGKTYFTGKSKEGFNLRGFFITNKKNPKQPDLRIYIVNDGELSKEALISMWCNVSKSGAKYLTGKLGEKRVVAFIRNSENEKGPYVVAYFSEDRKPDAKQEKIDLPKEDTSKEPF